MSYVSIKAIPKAFRGYLISVNILSIHSPMTKYKETQRSIYLRKSEQQAIADFLQSDSHVLHIFGNPGTGKTTVTLFTLDAYKYTYFNYLENTSFYTSRKMEKIVIIDEFDRFYEYKKKEAVRFISRPNRKIITLANKCIFADSLYFKTYTTDELIFILTKLNKNLSSDAIMLIAKRFNGQGDLRRALEYCNGVIDNKSLTADGNINHKMIKDVIKMCLSKKDVYEKYVEHCKENMTPYLGRCDFYVIYEMYI